MMLALVLRLVKPFLGSAGLLSRRWVPLHQSTYTVHQATNLVSWYLPKNGGESKVSVFPLKYSSETK